MSFSSDRHTEVRGLYLHIFHYSSLYSSHFSNYRSHTENLVCYNISGFEEEKKLFTVLTEYFPRSVHEAKPDLMLSGF